MEYESFHAHVYYDQATRPQAAELREQLERVFPVQMGRWHDQPVGPHPQGMYQVAFVREHFADILQWLMHYHTGLSVLIHPNSGDDVADHSERALWLGRQLDLNLEGLR